MQVVTIRLLQRYRLRHVPTHRVELSHSVTLGLKTGMLMTAHPI
jgi:hypothetical protein